MERRRAAVLATDIVGYSRMMEADEIGTLGLLKTWREGLFAPAVKRHGGRIFKTTGDGALAEFPGAAGAIACAQEVQAAMHDHPGGLTLRIGINVGMLILDDGDAYGDAVNVAARLEGMAAPGGILISEQARGGLDAGAASGFHDNGERKFKNISRRIRVWSWPDRLPTVGTASKPRVHVAPFEGGDAAEQRLAGDLRAEILSHMARLTGLEVVAGAEDAGYVLEGSVRLGAGRCRVHARITTRRNGSQIWAGRVDHPTDDPFDVIDTSAPRIVMGLRRRVAQDDADRLRDRLLDELSLEELMALAGVSFFNPTIEGWRGGGLIAEQALEIAPDAFMALAMAAAGLGLAEPLYGWRATPPEVIGTAFSRIEHALRLNNRSDMLHCTHSGLLLYGRLRHGEAKAAAHRALEVNADFNMGHWVLGTVQVFGGAPEDGCRSAERAVAINPDDPYVHLYSRIAGHGQLAAGRPEAAWDWFQRADQLSPGLVPNLAGLAVAARRAGEQDEAADVVGRLARIAPEFRLAGTAPLPFSDRRHWQSFAADLRAAGAPE